MILKRFQNTHNNTVIIDGENFKERYLINKLYYNGTYNSGFKDMAQFCNVLTFLSFMVACILSLWDNSAKLYDVGNWRINDGHWLMLLSPFVFAYWILLTAILATVFIILVSLWCVSLLWAMFIEFPADCLNKNKIDKLTDEYNKSENKHPIELAVEDIKHKSIVNDVWVEFHYNSDGKQII